jgi:aryl-alcohol dehydrogenase-like predicted oxidoreductase
MSMNRRQFLKTSALILGTVALARPSLVQARDVPTRFFNPYEAVPLGKTGLKMSRFCLGTGMRGGNRQSNHTRMGKEKFSALIRGVFERGGNVFDLADLYGTHPYVIPALKEIPRDKYIIISKLWFHKGGLPEQERPDADVVIERFLKELGTDHIDLLLLHCVTDPKWNTSLQKQMEIISKCKAKGMVRAHGVSCHSLEALQAAVTEPWVQSVHARINPYGMSMDGPAEKVTPVLKQLHDAGKGVIGMKIVGEGKLRNEPAKLDESIRFVLQLGTVDILNVGCESLQDVDDFAARVKKVPMPG